MLLNRLKLLNNVKLSCKKNVKYEIQIKIYIKEDKKEIILILYGFTDNVLSYINYILTTPFQ